jgi:hypothetical protein
MGLRDTGGLRSPAKIRRPAGTSESFGTGEHNLSRQDTGNIDVLVCFHCSAIALYGTPKIKSKLNVFWRPHISRAVEKVVNAIFQKNKIEQDSH